MIGRSSAEVAERDGKRGARDDAEVFLRRIGGENAGTDGDGLAARGREAAKAAVYVTDALDAADDLLADVAAFVEINVRPVEPGLGGEGVFIQLEAPARDGGLDAKKLGEFIADDGELCGELLPNRREDFVFRDEQLAAGNAEPSGGKAAQIGDSFQLLHSHASAVDQCGVVRDVGDGDIVGDDVFFQPCRKGLSDGGIRIHNDCGGNRGDENVGAELALCGGDAGGLDAARAGEFCGDLAV